MLYEYDYHSTSTMNIHLSPALHLGAQAGSASCITALLSKGADPNLQDNLQQTALFPACEGGHGACVQGVSTLVGIMEIQS